MYWFEDEKFVESLKSICKKYHVKGFNFDCKNGIGWFLGGTVKCSFKYLCRPKMEFNVCNVEFQSPEIKKLSSEWSKCVAPHVYRNFEVTFEIFFEVRETDREIGLNLRVKHFPKDLMLTGLSFDSINEQMIKFRNEITEFYVEINEAILNYEDKQNPNKKLNSEVED